MPTSFTNNWKNILDKLESVFKTEFKGALKVMIGASSDIGGQYLSLEPLSSDLISLTKHSEEREFSIEISYHFKDVNIKSKALDHILRYVSRIEALIQNNVVMTYTNESSVTEKIYNCRIESTNLGEGSDGEYIVVFDLKCLHLGNLS
tara:strand:+ start:16 stop:459 length:444 start_codon:yes stop_codon:yes gene_type:complete